MRTLLNISIPLLCILVLGVSWYRMEKHVTEISQDCIKAKIRSVSIMSNELRELNNLMMEMCEQ